MARKLSEAVDSKGARFCPCIKLGTNQKIAGRDSSLFEPTNDHICPPRGRCSRCKDENCHANHLSDPSHEALLTIEDSCSPDSSGQGIFDRKEVSHFQIRSLTPQPAKHCRQAEPAGNALAFAVHGNMKPPALKHGVAGSKTVKAGNSIKAQGSEIKNFSLRFLDDEAPLVQKIVPPGRCGRKGLLL
jgi:hypothetical protein